MRSIDSFVGQEPTYVNNFEQIFGDFKLVIDQKEEVRPIYAYLSPILYGGPGILEKGKVLFTDGEVYFVAELEFTKGPYDSRPNMTFDHEEYSEEDFEAILLGGLWNNVQNVESGETVNEELKAIFKI